MTEVVSIERDGASRARAALERTVAGGGVAVFPADTLYGLACDPLNADAIERIHALKGRDEGKPSAVMYFSPLAMRELVSDLGPRARDAVAALTPGAVTLVVANPHRRYPLACREDPERLGLRLVAGPLAGASVALFQTSANRSGESAPGRFEELDPLILEGADVAIDGGDVEGAPSTVIDLARIDEDGSWRILRHGSVPASEIERTLAALA